MPLHLGLDFLSGALLAVSPWLFGFAGEIWWLHVLFGMLEIGASLTTQMRPSGAAAAHA